MQAASLDSDQVDLSADMGAGCGGGWGRGGGLLYNHVIYVRDVSIDRTANGNTVKDVFSTEGDIVACQFCLRY